MPVNILTKSKKSPQEGYPDDLGEDDHRYLVGDPPTDEQIDDMAKGQAQKEFAILLNKYKEKYPNASPMDILNMAQNELSRKRGANDFTGTSKVPSETNQTTNTPDIDTTSIKESDGMDNIIQKSTSQLMAERYAQGVPTGSFTKSTAFQKSPPTFYIDTPEASDMLQDKSGAGTHNRHAEYVKLKDAHNDIQNGAGLSQALRDNIGDDPLMGHGRAAYSPEPADQLVVVGRKDKDIPISEGGKMYSKLIGMDQVEDIRKRHAAKQAAADLINANSNPLASILVAATKSPHMYWDDESYEDARARNVKNAVQNQKTAQETALADAKKILIDAGYPEDVVDQMLSNV